MFDLPGISVDDLPWIHRDQFVHYIELAHALGDPADWPGFRTDLLRALTAAFGLDAPSRSAAELTPRQHRAVQLLEDIHREHEPATDWRRFFKALWSRRHVIRPDLP